MKDLQPTQDPSGGTGVKKKRNRRRRKPRSAKHKSDNTEKTNTATSPSKKPHDAPMTKRDLYFTLNCNLVTIGQDASAVARVTMLNWDAEIVLDTFVQVPVPVTDFRNTGISKEAVSSSNRQAMSFAKVRQAVHRILKGKILVGHNLQEHLTSLGLTHPSTDVRDCANFRLFQYTEIDGVTDEQIAAQRSLADLAGEFLQREIDHDLSPMEASVLSLDLYKAFRSEWEQHLVQQAHQNENAAQYQQQQNYQAISTAPQSSLPIGSHEAGMRPRIPSYDHAYLQYPTHPVDLQAYSTYGAISSAYGSSTCGDSTSLQDVASNYGSSVYYDDSSVLSEPCTTESLAKSIREEAAGFRETPVRQSSSSSWFRFGSRKSRSFQPPRTEPMTSLTEGPDDTPAWPDQENLGPVDKFGVPLNYNNVTRGDPKQSSSWFSFRRPRSPRQGKRPEDSEDEKEVAPFNRRESSGVNERRPSLDSACGRESRASNGRPSSIGSSVDPIADDRDDASQLPTFGEPEKQPGSWFSFRRSSKKRQSQESIKDEKVLEVAIVKPLPRPAQREEEDWMREVVGSPTSQKKDILSASFLEDSEIEYDIGLEPEPQPPQKESAWLPRFLRSSAKPSSVNTAAELSNEPPNDPWLKQAVSSGSMNGGDNVLNPSFFEASLSPSTTLKAFDDADFPRPRARFPTEATLVTVPSEHEDETLPESEDFGKDFAHEFEQNLSFLQIS